MDLPRTHELSFFNPYATIRQTENRLPHWQQLGAVYFVTYRLADALPCHLLTHWQHERDNWLRMHPLPWSDKIEHEYHQRFSGAVERWLDVGYGSCLLRCPEHAQTVANTLSFFEDERTKMLSFVVMPNHVHALFVLNAIWTLEKVIRSWKRFSSREINRGLERSGSLWQRDYFDRLVRDQQHFANCVRYIRRNPKRARLTGGQYILFENDIARAIAEFR